MAKILRSNHMQREAMLSNETPKSPKESARTKKSSRSQTKGTSSRSRARSTRSMRKASGGKRKTDAILSVVAMRVPYQMSCEKFCYIFF